MRNILITLLMGSFILVAGCAPVPQNPGEFRLAVDKGAFMSNKDVSEVNRSYSRVSRSIKKMAPKCLNKRITTTSRTHNKYGGSTRTIVTDYTAKVRKSKKKTELSWQQNIVSGSKMIGNIPEGGFYSLVADFEPAGRKKTKVTIYGNSMQKKIFNAIKSWAKGKTLCPDLTQ